MADEKKRILNNIVPISSPTLALMAPSFDYLTNLVSVSYPPVFLIPRSLVP